MKSNFNETDFYLIANSGAMDYIFKTHNMGNNENLNNTDGNNPLAKSNTYLE